MLGIITGHNWSLISECNLIVILNSCILLVSSLQIAFGKIIYLQEKAMKQGILSVVRENRLCSPLKILARLKLLFSSSCHSKKAQSYHTLFNSMSGKNLSAWSLNAVALISPCRKIGELVRTEIWHGKRFKKKKKKIFAMLSGSSSVETVGSARVAPGVWETNNVLFTSVVGAKNDIFYTWQSNLIFKSH